MSGGKVPFSMRQADFFEDLKKRFGKEGSYYTYFYHQEEIHELFYDPESFFQAWYCGYKIYEEDDKLSLF